MRVERAPYSWAAVVFSGALLLGAATSGRAQGLSGFAQVEFQELSAPGSYQRTWLQSYQFNQANSFGDQLRMLSQLQLNRTTFVGRPDSQTLPRGTFRLMHPMAGFFFSHQPSSAVDALGVSTKLQETQISSYFAKPGLPRLDLSWIRRHRDANSEFTMDASTTRSARMSHSQGPMDVRLGYSDQTENLPGDVTRDRFQKTWDGGAALRLGLIRAVPLVLQYDFTSNTLGGSLPGAQHTRSQDIMATSNSRITPKLDWSGNYTFRHTDVLGNLDSHLDDQEGSGIVSYHPTTATRVSVGGGVRTVQLPVENAVAGYAVATLGAQGEVRPHWRGSADVAQSLNGMPGRGAVWISTYHAGSILEMARGLELTPDVLVSANGDTAAGSTNTVTQASVGLRAIPVKAIAILGSVKIYNVGPSIFTTVGRSRSAAWDVRWQPSPTLQMMFDYSTSRALPDATERTSTTQINLDWKPSGNFQTNAHLTRSRGYSPSSAVAQLSGNDVQGFRVLTDMGRGFRVSTTYNIADPGKPTHSSIWDVTVTRSFGR